ncbi:MAG: M48 family metalloprotease [Burkholderiales bacterium]|nr:M48 family metalloprotease [Burkholderiales bacterium]
MRIKTFACVVAAVLTALTPVPAAYSQNYNLPDLGAAGGATLSPLEERKMGEQIMQEVRADPDYLSDSESSEYLQRLGYKLVSAGPSNPYTFTFFPVRDSSINAFALPGGFVAVFTGLFVAAQNESELASVLAHEIAHVQQRHIARMLESQKGNLAWTIASLLVAVLAARAGSGDGAAAAVVGTQAAMAQKTLSFSRDAEREADRVGFQSLVKAGFDPRGMEDFFHKLDLNSRIYEGPRAAPAYLRTHPLTIDRISEAQNRSRLSKPVNHKDSLDFFLIRARMRVLQADRQQGWIDAQKYFKEEIKTAKGYDLAANHYGMAVALQKMHRPAEALKEAELAKSIAGTKSTILDKLISELTFAAGQRDRGIQLAKQTFDASPTSQLALLNYADLLYRSKKYNETVNLMRKQHALSKQTPLYQSILGRCYEALGKKSLSHQAIGEMYALNGEKVAAIQQFSIAQRSNDGDFYTMSEIDARLRQLRKEVDEDKKYK